ncbi:inorganic phosphate transporter [Hanamia caeni]|jgi:PiT family inorganic phosphate transporter|uniref:Inorganic phosphate transporter n=1 Tax=Hanamia caeni TaxID=2294116 RepID=A0A3M9NPB8_9BACT|nr:inorganic phosphate transporter [Hanamia caeni]RNI39177.1 inorganic phosphate transporter [Hanamia caeni]
MLVFLITIIVLALVFDYINGFHDAANSIATIVSTKVLTPFQAVLWAASFNFIAFFVFREHKVAGTIANIMSENIINFKTIIAATIAAISWNLLTWYYGIPSSSSHTLIGGLAGAALAAGGIAGVNTHPVFIALIFMVLAPIIGLLLGFAITVITVHIAKRSRPARAEKWFRRLQLLSSACLSLAHGGGDSQKTMGLILTAIWFYEKTVHGATVSIPEMAMPEWLPLACYSAIALGTMSGGWRIVKTMGTRITKVNSLEGFCAETAGAVTIFLTIGLGIPVSTTHTLTGSIVGVGATKRLSAVRWGVTINLLWAWILTIPVSALVAAVVYYIIHFLS